MESIDSIAFDSPIWSLYKFCRLYFPVKRPFSLYLSIHIIIINDNYSNYVKANSLLWY